MSRSLRFILIPKVTHPWFEEVNKGAQVQAGILSRETGSEIVVDYMPPPICNADAQNAILENAVVGQPSGIAIDPVDAVNNMAAIRHVRDSRSFSSTRHHLITASAVLATILPCRDRSPPSAWSG